MLPHQNTTGATSQGHFCTMFLLYQGKGGQGQGPRTPGLGRLAYRSRRSPEEQSARPAPPMGPIFPAFRKKPASARLPRPSYNARL